MKNYGRRHLKTETFAVRGMVCGSCEKLIARGILKSDGIHDVKADYAGGTCTVTYDTRKTTVDEIKKAAEAAGYDCSPKPAGNGVGQYAVLLGALVIFVAAYMVLEPKFAAYTPSIGQNASLALLFIIGLLTGFHCIAMCGGFVVSYTSKQAADGRTGYMPHLKYGAAKTLSYTVFGAVFGLAGSYITFTPMMRGLAAAFAGMFLIGFGLNMLGFLEEFKRFRLTTPSFVNRFIASKTGGDSGPTTMGLLNGLMIACGPLQAIYLLAAASGSAYQGALYLAAFGLGTLPVLLGFGAFASALSGRMTHRILRYSGVMVLILGAIMLNRGIALTGTGYDLNTVLAASTPTIIGAASAQADSARMDGKYQVIHMNVTAQGWSPDRFVLRKGVPVKWVIDGQEITSCNNAIQVPKYGLKFDVKKGVQTIEFMPDEAGTVPWSCWMGMITGTFTVVDETAQAPGPAETTTTEKADRLAGREQATGTTVQTAYTTTTTEKQKARQAGTASTVPPATGSNAGYQTVYMNVTYAGWEPNRFVLKAGVPVKWVIDGQQLTGCNSAIKVPLLDLQFPIKPGMQTIEFIPEEARTIPWSCWMGMIKGTFIVKDNIDTTSQEQVQKVLDATPPTPRGGSCNMGGGGGGCGCGMM